LIACASAHCTRRSAFAMRARLFISSRYSFVFQSPCMRMLAPRTSSRKQPHDSVLPFKLLVGTNVVLPHSHRHSQTIPPLPMVSVRPITVKRPVTLPVMSLIFFAVMALPLLHPQDVVQPFLILRLTTYSPSPQSQMQQANVPAPGDNRVTTSIP
jgi:hypothetical protein